MIVEYTGPTGAGKSTYITQTATNLSSQGINVEIIGQNQPLRKSFASLQVMNWKADVFSFPWACMLLTENPRYAWFLINAMLGVKTHRISIFRSILRKLGIHRFLSRRQFQDTVFLVDEGIIHVGHNLLVSTSENDREKLFSGFAELTPIPTLAVILTAPYKVLISRLKIRGDLSPRISSEEDLVSFVNNAVRFYSYVSPILIKRTRGFYIDTAETEEIEVITMVLTAISELLNSNITSSKAP